MSNDPTVPPTLSGPAVVSCVSGHWTISFFPTMTDATRFAAAIAVSLPSSALFVVTLQPLTFPLLPWPNPKDLPHARN